MSISSSSDCLSLWKHIILAILPGHVDPIWWSSYFQLISLAYFMISIWPGLPIIFHWKSPSFSAVERYFSVVRPFNQLRNRFFFRFKIWPKYFFCRGFCDPPWRSRSPAFSSPSSSLSPTISCSPQCASKHNQLAEFLTSFPFSLLNSSPACHLFYFSLQGASCAFWLPPELYISSGLSLGQVSGRVNFCESGSQAPVFAFE